MTSTPVLLPSSISSSFTVGFLLLPHPRLRSRAAAVSSSSPSSSSASACISFFSGRRCITEKCTKGAVTGANFCIAHGGSRAARPSLTDNDQASDDAILVEATADLPAPEGAGEAGFPLSSTSSTSHPVVPTDAIAVAMVTEGGSGDGAVVATTSVEIFGNEVTATEIEAVAEPMSAFTSTVSSCSADAGSGSSRICVEAVVLGQEAPPKAATEPLALAADAPTYVPTAAPLVAPSIHPITKLLPHPSHAGPGTSSLPTALRWENPLLIEQPPSPMSAPAVAPALLPLSALSCAVPSSSLSCSASASNEHVHGVAALNAANVAIFGARPTAAAATTFAAQPVNTGTSFAMLPVLSTQAIWTPAQYAAATFVLPSAGHGPPETTLGLTPCAVSAALTVQCPYVRSPLTTSSSSTAPPGMAVSSSSVLPTAVTMAQPTSRAANAPMALQSLPVVVDAHQATHNVAVNGAAVTACSVTAVQAVPGAAMQAAEGRASEGFLEGGGAVKDDGGAGGLGGGIGFQGSYASTGSTTTGSGGILGDDLSAAIASGEVRTRSRRLRLRSRAPHLAARFSHHILGTVQ